MSGNGGRLGPVTDIEGLRQRAQERIIAGTLPLQNPERSWTGNGTGEACGVCGVPIEPTRPEYDLEFASGPGPILVRFHRACLAMWELLRRGC